MLNGVFDIPNVMLLTNAIKCIRFCKAVFFPSLNMPPVLGPKVRKALSQFSAATVGVSNRFTWTTSI